MNEPLPILLAAWQDVIGALVPVAFLLIWVISQLADAKKVGGAGRPQQPQQPRRPQPPPQGAAPGRPAQAPGGAMRDQVEEFLRRAGRPPRPDQRRPAGDPLDPAAARQRPRPLAAEPPEEIEVLLDEPRPAPQPSPLAKPLRPLGQPPGQPPARRPRRPMAAKPRPESVAEHVVTYVDNTARALGEHAAHLGDSVIQADQQFDVQLKAKFDHRLGTLASERTAGASETRPAPPAAPAAQIAAMLADPQGVRQAIVLSEILNRPIDRW